METVADGSAPDDCVGRHPFADRGRADMLFGRSLPWRSLPLPHLLCSALLLTLTTSDYEEPSPTNMPSSFAANNAGKTSGLEETSNATGGLYLADVIPGARKHAPLDGVKSPQEDSIERADMLEAYEAGAATPDKAVRSDSDMSGTGTSLVLADSWITGVSSIL